MRHCNLTDRISDTGGAKLALAPPAPDVPVLDTSICTNAYQGTLPPMSNDAWREKCQTEVRAEIPAGMTYLGQLIVHDFGRTVRSADVPYALGAGGDDAGLLWNGGRVLHNLVDNPLALETLYGRGPFQDHLLYLPTSLLFILNSETPDFAATITYENSDILGGQKHNLLADERNADNFLLHRLTVLWMKFHNHIASAYFHGQVGADDSDAERAKQWRQAFCHARALVLQTWHNVILNEFLPAVADPVLVVKTKLPPVANTPLLHGVLRAMHCLPLMGYRINGQDVSLGRILLGDETAPIRSEWLKWQLIWNDFFTDGRDGPVVNLTGMTASYPTDFDLAEGVTPQVADLKIAQSVCQIGWESDVFETFRGFLPNDLKQDAAEVFCTRYNALWGHAEGAGEPESQFENLPLFVFAMLEGQFFGSGGRLGPCASAMLASGLRGRIEGLQTAMGDGHKTQLASLQDRGLKPLNSIMEIVELLATKE